MEREALFSSFTFDDDAIECIGVEERFASLFSAEYVRGLHPCRALYGLSQTLGFESPQHRAICRLAASGRSRPFPLVLILGNLQEMSSELWCHLKDGRCASICFEGGVILKIPSSADVVVISDPSSFFSHAFYL